MATTTKKNTTKSTTKKVEEVKTVKTQPVETKESEEVLSLKQQIEEMKKAMEALMSAKNEAIQPAQKLVVMNEEQEVVIGCRVLQGIGWQDPTHTVGEVRLDFNEEISIPISDMKRFLRQHSVRKLFEDGLCYFADPESYKLFNIRKYIDLSDENLITILTKSDINDIIRDLDKITDNQKNGSIVNCIVFRICDMIRKHTINLDYYTRKGVEGYFNIEFDRGIFTLDAFDNVRI